MARLIVKSPYIKRGGEQSAGGYLKYIATRERVEFIPDDRPPTQKQTQLIEKLVKDFPDAKELIALGFQGFFLSLIKVLYFSDMDKSTYFVSFSPGLSQKLCRIICPMHKKKKDFRRERKSFFLILYVFLQSGPADAL